MTDIARRVSWAVAVLALAAIAAGCGPRSVALYVPEEKGNDLEKPGTLWSLRLLRADEVDFEPVYIRKLSLRPEEISRFFPYSGTWYRAYEVAFPLEAGEPAGSPRVGSPRLKLVLSGVEGRAVLAWQ